MEGLVLKRAESLYVPGRTKWVKVRHAETVDANLVAVVGPADRPTHLVVPLTGRNGPAHCTTRRCRPGLGGSGCRRPSRTAQSWRATVVDSQRG
jgi:hypothetical protein